MTKPRKERTKWWAIMELNKWSTMSAHGFPVMGPPGWAGFLPVFDTKKDALKHAKDKSSVVEIRIKI